MAFSLRLPRGMSLVQIAIQVERQQVRRLLVRTSCSFGLRLGKAESGNIHTYPEINDPDQVVFRYQFIQRDRELAP